MSDSKPLVQAQDLAMSFDVSAPWLNRLIEGKPRQLLHAVDGVSFSIQRGQTLALVGESGCGKSTVARLLVGLYQPTRGSMHFDGQDAHAAYRSADARALRQRIQMIFQDPYASLNPRWTVLAIVGEPLREHGLIQDEAGLKDRVAELLASVGLSAQDMGKYPHQFSGGQRQRIGSARALAVAPDFVVAEGPGSALDVSVQAQIVTLLVELRRRLGLTMLFISHDLAVVEHLCDHVIVLYLGKVMEIAPAAEIYAAPRQPYTRALLSAAPQPDPDAPRRRILLSGDLPSPANPPPGCVFSTRCPSATERCRREVPALEEKSPGRCVACLRADEIDAPG
ncbi:MAG: ABC transporter ATP-binding protein [Alphaproteobacteria bacterium]